MILIIAAMLFPEFLGLSHHHCITRHNIIYTYLSATVDVCTAGIESRDVGCVALLGSETPLVPGNGFGPLVAGVNVASLYARLRLPPACGISGVAFPASAQGRQNPGDRLSDIQGSSIKKTHVHP